MITIDDLDYIVRDVAFEGFVLNHYGNFGSSSVFAYLHGDVTNQFGFSIVSVTLNGALVTLHNVKFICRNHV
jgi:hypothetical protein